VSTSRARRGAGFTLIELMAVVLLTGIVLGAAADSYLDLSAASRAAVERSREAREAVGVLDRMARDLEGAVLLVKPPDLDPIAHPWLFLAEADSEAEGARRLKFVTRSHRPRASDATESDLAMVAFVAEPDEDGTLVLRRALAPGLPEELDRSFPRDERDGADVLAEGLARFGMRLLTEEGEWAASFDSTTLVHSGQLPLAVEIELAFAREDEDGALVEGLLYARQVRLPLRPLDLEAELGAAEDEAAPGEDDGEEEAGMTVQECLAKNPSVLEELDVPPEVLDSIRGQPLSAVGLSEGDCE
jgi:prepilin-type N-terminal cleavage/methylation domain-containing protein